MLNALFPPQAPLAGATKQPPAQTSHFLKTPLYSPLLNPNCPARRLFHYYLKRASSIEASGAETAKQAAALPSSSFILAAFITTTTTTTSCTQTPAAEATNQAVGCRFPSLNQTLLPSPPSNQARSFLTTFPFAALLHAGSCTTNASFQTAQRARKHGCKRGAQPRSLRRSAGGERGPMHAFTRCPLLLPLATSNRSSNCS